MNDQTKMLRELLKVARCPGTQCSPNSPHPCQWCDEREAALAAEGDGLTEVDALYQKPVSKEMDEALNKALEDSTTVVSEGDGWRSMESAPRGGARILLSWSGNSVVGFFLDNGPRYRVWRTLSGEVQPPGQPDGWMPIPNPPPPTDAEDA